MEDIRNDIERFRDVLFWTALKHGVVEITDATSFRDVLFWTALKQETQS